MNNALRESLYGLYEQGGLELMALGTRGTKRELWLNLELIFIHTGAKMADALGVMQADSVGGALLTVGAFRHQSHSISLVAVQT